MFRSIPLGWLQLKAQKLRLVAAVTGIAFAVILIFVQLEFREALFVSAVRYHNALDYDLAMLSPKTDFMVSSKQFPRARLYQVLGMEGVQSTTAVYMRLVSWRNPVDPSNARNILAIGFDPSEPGLRPAFGSAESICSCSVFWRWSPWFMAAGQNARSRRSTRRCSTCRPARCWPSPDPTGRASSTAW